MKVLTPKLFATIVPLSFLPASVMAATFLTVSTTTGIIFGQLDDGACINSRGKYLDVSHTKGLPRDSH